MTTNEKALLLHEEWKGKLETVSKPKVASREDLALAYTPGVRTGLTVKMFLKDLYGIGE